MINFVTVKKEVQALNAQFLAGELDAQNFEARLLTLMDVGADGHYWMFGHETGQWFRHDGRAWQPDTPNFAAGGQTTSDVATWSSVDLNWFITSMVLLIAIGSLVYTSV